MYSKPKRKKKRKTKEKESETKCTVANTSSLFFAHSLNLSIFVCVVNVVVALFQCHVALNITKKKEIICMNIIRFLLFLVSSS